MAMTLKEALALRLPNGTQLGELVRRADGVCLDAAIRQISRIAVYLQAFRGAQREIAEADTLYISRDEVTFGLFVLSHKAVDCNRERKSREAMVP